MPWEHIIDTSSIAYIAISDIAKQSSGSWIQFKATDSACLACADSKPRINQTLIRAMPRRMFAKDVNLATIFIDLFITIFLTNFEMHFRKHQYYQLFLGKLDA